MSGHEKFYIPHDDLLELKDSIDTLDVSINTLDADVITLSTAMLKPDTETVVTDSATLTAGFDSESPISEILSATDDTYVIRARVTLIAVEDIFLKYDADISIAISYEDALLMSDFFCQGKYPMVAGNAGRTLWLGDRMFNLDKARIPAGKTLGVSLYGYDLSVDTAVVVWAWYQKEVKI